MRVLLLAMPDTADVIDYYARIPNLALVSLAGNLPDHEVKVLDLVMCKRHVRRAVSEALASFRPQLVGLSAMTFQFDRLLRVARLVRDTDPSIRIAAGGYHATLLTREIVANHPDLPLDFMIRGEGELTLAELLAELERKDPDLGGVSGLSYRDGNLWRHNPDRMLCNLDALALPNRQSRLANGFFMLHFPLDVAETSRGCPFNCKFCSINRMYGRTFRPFSAERVVADLQRIRARGTRAVFLIDDNITYDIDHFRRICQAIVRHGLNDMFYIVQATAVGIAENPDLVADMDRANFRTVFVGFESMAPNALRAMNKPTSPAINQKAARLLRKHNMAIVAGCIVGYPDDTQQSVRDSYRSIKSLRPDLIYAQYLTPYPGTQLRSEMLEAGLVENADDYRSYDGFSCNIRTRHMSRKELYRVLKKEAVKGFLDPKLIASNFFLRRYPAAFLKPIVKAMLTNCYNVLQTRQMKCAVDV